MGARWVVVLGLLSGTVGGSRASAATVDEVLRRHSDAVRSRLEPLCRAVGIDWPPRRLQLLAFKREGQLEVWVANKQGAYRKLTTYPILAQSGGSGPKRRQGDLQVPEGFYRLPYLNPNSNFHLSIKVDYPNAEDVKNSTVSRPDMGGDIFIHGNAVSIGCLAMGDPAIEELFTLAALVPARERRIIIAPVDFRRGVTPPAADAWVTDLYARLATALRDLPVSASP